VGSWDAVVWDTSIGMAIVFFATVFLHGHVRRMAIAVPLRVVFAVLTVAMMVPDRLLQGGCFAAGFALFFALRWIACSGEARSGAQSSV
jgi:hypothetical protein